MTPEIYNSRNLKGLIDLSVYNKGILIYNSRNLKCLIDNTILTFGTTNLQQQKFKMSYRHGSIIV